MTNQSSFEGKSASSDASRHVRHPSQDFILGSGNLATMQTKLGFDVPAVSSIKAEGKSTGQAAAPDQPVSQNQPPKMTREAELSNEAPHPVCEVW